MAGPAPSPSTTGWGDVVLPKRRGFQPPLALKRSIDIRRVTFTPVGRDVRIIVAMRQVLHPKRLDQIIEVQWRETGRNPWSGDVFADSRAWRATATYGGPGFYDTTTNCSVRAAISTRYNAVAMTVPYRCIPVGPLTISVKTLLGEAQTDAPIQSRDAVNVPGHPTFDDGQ